MKEPEKSSEGLYILRHETTFLHWLAWRDWVVQECGTTYFRSIMNVISPWPPESYAAAKIAAAHENAIRTRVKFGRAAPPDPKPWMRWTATEMNEIEMAEMTRRDREGYSAPAPGIGIPVSREGFHRATAAEHRAAAYELEQYDAWFKGKVRESMLRDPDLGKRLRRSNLIPAVRHE